MWKYKIVYHFEGTYISVITQIKYLSINIRQMFRGICTL